jgi:pilus assembly protein FimV
VVDSQESLGFFGSSDGSNNDDAVDSLDSFDFFKDNDKSILDDDSHETIDFLSELDEHDNLEQLNADLDVSKKTVDFESTGFYATKDDILDIDSSSFLKLEDMDDESTEDLHSLDFGSGFVLTDIDELETKIDLAKAYIDMGDADAAKEIAEDILARGSVDQKREAQAIIDAL